MASNPLDPVSKYDLLFSVRLNYAVSNNSDWFYPCPEEQRVLMYEIYVVADAEYHAAYSNRGLTLLHSLHLNRKDNQHQGNQS